MGGQLRRSLEAQRANRVTASNSDMARTQVEARVPVRGSGETRVAIEFPVLYAQQPIMTFGGELDANHTPEEGNFPVISVMVVDWTTVERDDQRTYYSGCEVAIVALGKTNQRVTAHVLFEALAFRDPSVGGTGLEEAI